MPCATRSPKALDSDQSAVDVLGVQVAGQGPEPTRSDSVTVRQIAAQAIAFDGSSTHSLHANSSSVSTAVRRRAAPPRSPAWRGDDRAATTQAIVGELPKSLKPAPPETSTRRTVLGGEARGSRRRRTGSRR